jgi:hypothetical protein
MRKAIRKWLMTILLYNVVLMALLYQFIDNAAHIGGLVGGLLVGLAVTRSPLRRERVRPWQIAVLAGLVPLLVAGGVWAWQRIPAPEAVKPWDVAERTEAAVLGAEDAVEQIETLMESAAEIWTPLRDEQAQPAPEDLRRLRNIRLQLEHVQDRIASPRDLGGEAAVVEAGVLQAARDVARTAVVTVRRAVNALTYRGTEDAPPLPEWDQSDPYHRALARYHNVAALVDEW